MAAPTIADLPIWDNEPDRIQAELTGREVEVINQLRTIKSDDVYVAITDMVSAMVEFRARQAAAGEPEKET